MKRKSLLVLAITLMVVGFASVSTTLFINGATNVASNTIDFDVYFSKAYENGIEKKELIKDKTHITFTAELHEVDEVYELKYEVTNASKNYDVSVSINVPNGNEYIRAINDFDTSNLLARTSREGTLTLKVIKGVTEEITFPIEITINVNAVERTTLGEDTIRSETPYKENILNGTDPVLKNELIPVTIANKGEVTYADIYTKWYNYENKEWANAVILKSGVTHEVGDIIPEADIESYFVWIPKYKYQIFDMGNYTSYINGKPTESSIAKEIQIEFTLDETEDTETSCVSPKIAGESGTCSVGKWMTHPAFQKFGVIGLWVGKFETGNNNGIIVKPNVTSWRNVNVATFFKTSYDYKRELDSHMMKNTEWGAVAYLSHSKYGINTEVRINNNSDYITGYATANGTKQDTFYGTTGTTEDVTLPYNTETGYKASTTGNITGVYDMSGGSGEYMAAYSGIGSSGITSTDLTTYEKYFDVYPSNSTITSYNKRILGDATGEMGKGYYYLDEKTRDYFYHNNWYADYYTFVEVAYPWFFRGCAYYCGVLSGPFDSNRESGGASNVVASRVVLAVK